MLEIKVVNLQTFYQNFTTNPLMNMVQQSYLYKMEIRFDRADNEIDKSYYGFKEVVSFMVHDIDIPSLTTDGGVAVSPTTDFGKMSFPGKFSIIPTKDTFTVSFLNSEYSIHEIMFVEWLKQVQSNRWCFANVPYLTAIIQIDFIRQETNKDSYDEDDFHMSYIMRSCYPKAIDLLKPDYAAKIAPYRNITFGFDYIDVLPRAVRKVIQKAPSNEILALDNESQFQQEKASQFSNIA